jgi:carbamoyl-phosphate synthase large subunit
MKKKKFNILVSCFTSKKFPILNLLIKSTKRIDKNIKIYLGNKNFDQFNDLFIDQCLIIPDCKDINKNKILRILKKKNIRFVFPTSDLELLFWSKNKNYFYKNNIIIMISEFNSIKLCSDKLSFSNFCASRKIPAIKILSKDEALKSKCSLVAKERYSIQKNKIILNKKYKFISNSLKNFNEPILQRYITGKEISIDAFLNENSMVIGIVLRKRNLIIDGESKISTIIRNSNLEREFTKYFQLMNLTGLVMMQCIISNKKVYIIECNPRIGGASTLSIQYGLDVFYWFIKKSLDKNFKPVFKRNNKLKQYRLPVDFYL